MMKSVTDCHFLFVILISILIIFGRFHETLGRKTDVEELDLICHELRNETFSIVYDVYGVSLRFRLECCGCF